MAWLSNNYVSILSIALILSEALGAICQLLFPSNKGVSGFFAGLIKALQTLGAKNPNA
jgi:hypothetical protein